MKNHVAIALCQTLTCIFVLTACASLPREPLRPSDTAAKTLQLSSPFSPVVVEITEANLNPDLRFYPNERRLYYRLLHDQTPLVLFSPLGLKTETTDFTGTLSVAGVEKFPIAHNYTLAHGKARQVNKKGELFRLTLKNPQQQTLHLEFVLQPDAVALRYVLPGSGKTRILRETTGFRFAEGRQAVMQQYQEASKVSPAYEYYYEPVRVGSSDDGKASVRRIFQPVVGFTGLVIFGSDGWAMPALIEAAEKKYILLAEAGVDTNHAAVHLTNPVNNLYTVELPAEKEGNGQGEVAPTGELPYATAYRVIICCDLKSIAESTAITDLSLPLDKRFGGKIPQWVRPGKATWDWLSYVGTGDPERQKKYIDAAHEFGWQYTLIDANWNKWNNGNAEPIVRDLIAYAQRKGVGLWLWYNSGGPNNTVTEEPRDLMHSRAVRRQEFSRLKAWGIKGVKIDFWQSDKQMMMQQYIETLEDAADYELMVNFHGCTTPKGWQRRFPNLVTMEAVKGAEWYQFPVFRGPNAHDNVYYALTRNVVGPMDYTPLVFAQALKQQKISYAHSLALSVVFESGVQHFADNADDREQGYNKLFSNYPFVQQFLRELPTAWEETRLLAADPLRYVVFARRSGQVWYVGGISADNEPLRLELELPLLPGRQYTAWQITEGNRPDELQSGQASVVRNYALLLRPRGGFLMRVE